MRLLANRLYVTESGVAPLCTLETDRIAPTTLSVLGPGCVPVVEVIVNLQRNEIPAILNVFSFTSALVTSGHDRASIQQKHRSGLCLVLSAVLRFKE